MKGFIVYRAYEEIEEKGYVLLYGRLENGMSFASMHEIKPYFFVQETDLHIVQKLAPEMGFEIEKTELMGFHGEKLIRLVFKNQSNLIKAGKELYDLDIKTFEQDIKPTARFMIDNYLLNSVDLDGEFRKDDRVGRFYVNPKISSCKSDFPLKVASIDLESGKTRGSLFCIGIHFGKLKECFMVTKDQIENVTSCVDEKECLEKFRQKLIEIDPDVIVGWNIIDFDFVFLKKLFDKNKIPFDIGRNGHPVKLRIEKNFMRKSSVDLPGRAVLDGLSMIRDPFIQEAPFIRSLNFESYSLESMAEQIVNKTKLLKGKERFVEIENLYFGTKQDRKKLAEYNLQDCILVSEIIEKTDMIKLSMERASLTGMPIDRLASSVASFDSLYIREARKRGFVSPSNYFNNKLEKIKGGFVIQPVPGLYKNVLVLDFKSLYPSIIRTFNIDPLSQLEEKEEGCVVSPNGAFFKNQDGILPFIIQNLFEERERAKKERRELSSYAIKIIMNSFFGVLASPNSRYFNLKMSNAITSFGQSIIKLTVKAIENMGYKVIYGDTDSIFVITNVDEKRSRQLGAEISREINNFYDGQIRKDYSRKSYLELEYDKLYVSLFIPKTRDSEVDSMKGAKKRYAGLLKETGKETLDIVGLEAIRGDWTEAAQDFQRELLMKVFRNQDVAGFIRNFVESLRNGRLNEKLVYRKGVRKELAEYTKTTPPHVKAARKLGEMEGNIIEYYMTSDGPEPIQKLRHPIDFVHYVEKQIKPIARSILDSIGINSEEIFSLTTQKKLF